MLSVDVRIPFYLEFVTTSILFCATQIALVTIQLKLVTIAISTICNGDPKTGLVQYLCCDPLAPSETSRDRLNLNQIYSHCFYLQSR